MTVALAGDSVRGSARGFAAQRAPRGERSCEPARGAPAGTPPRREGTSQTASAMTSVR